MQACYAFAPLLISVLAVWFSDGAGRSRLIASLRRRFCQHAHKGFKKPPSRPSSLNTSLVVRGRSAMSLSDETAALLEIYGAGYADRYVGIINAGRLSLDRALLFSDLRGSSSGWLWFLHWRFSLNHYCRSNTFIRCYNNVRTCAAAAAYGRDIAIDNCNEGCSVNEPLFKGVTCT
ncbi:hypothetical protein BV20DRAFT_826538 [Pilatotrama ljubarskyi]|nr:hypothetical protein BV20DRAFT_826538 [Pilatotrama ljubarskyi]